jgi:hypothetical protein
MLHAYLPLPLLAADVGCCATLGLDLQRCRGHLFAAQVNQALDRFVRPASYGAGRAGSQVSDIVTICVKAESARLL